MSMRGLLMFTKKLSSLLEHRCGSLTPNQQAHIQALSLSALETLIVALLDFQGPEDLNAWLSRHAS